MRHPAKPQECKYWHKHLKGSRWERNGREAGEQRLLLATTDTNIVSVKGALKQDLLGVRVGHIEHTQKVEKSKKKKKKRKGKGKPNVKRTYKQQKYICEGRKREGQKPVANNQTGETKGS